MNIELSYQFDIKRINSTEDFILYHLALVSLIQSSLTKIENDFKSP